MKDPGAENGSGRRETTDRMENKPTAEEIQLPMPLDTIIFIFGQLGSFTS